MNMTVKQVLGQKPIFGFHGKSLSENSQARFREYTAGSLPVTL